jgi:NAD(P)-dependent dehydrogenase (short-subunit alcohol dehydrogenase family)
MQIEGAVVVITGGSTGIGRAAARLLAERGARLVLASRRPERLDATVAALRAGGADVVGVPTDVGHLDQVEHLAATTWEQFGQVDVALFNAGAPSIDNLLDVDLAAWRTAIDTNVYGLLHCLKAFVPRMIARGSQAAVYATTSGAGIHGTTYATAPYAATKNTQLSIMESLYGQARDAGVPLHVGVVVPPLTRTNLVGDDLSVWDAVERGLSRDGRAPALIEPEEFAQVIVDGIEADRFWIAATAEDDDRYFGGRYAGAIRRSRRLVRAKADAVADHHPPDGYLW